MSTELKELLLKRLTALAWHAGAMLVPVLADFVVTNIGLFNTPEWVVVAIGLVFAQVTKYLNSKA